MTRWLIALSLLTVTAAQAGTTVLTQRVETPGLPGPAFVTPKSLLPKSGRQAIHARGETRTVLTAIR